MNFKMSCCIKMNELPLELLSFILSKADLHTLYKTAQVNKLYLQESKRLIGPEIKYYPDSKIVKCKIWSDMQGVKRIVKYEVDGKLKFEQWYKNDKLHRDDGPANKMWHNNGRIFYEEWFIDGKLHRNNGPSIQAWYKNGNQFYQWWHKSNLLERIDGPAVKQFYENGQDWCEYWCKDGEYHSLNNPAKRVWDINGNLTLEEWWKNGNLVQTPNNS